MVTDRLALAVISQAIRDVMRKAAKTKDAGKATVRKSEQLEAIAFLTEPVGGWALSRREWCEYANICPDRLRAAVIRHMQSGTNLKKLLEDFDYDKRRKANRSLKNNKSLNTRRLNPATVGRKAAKGRRPLA